MTQQTLAIVYQFGKVASTSLVATLNRMKNFDAVQSHFLGRKALSDVLQNLTRPDVPEYFFNHQLGQLYKNAQLTRRLSMIQTGQSTERLLVISVTREPIDWFRSVIVQDIEGHLPRFQNLLQRNGEFYLTDAEIVQHGLQHMLRIFCDIIEVQGGLDPLIKTMSHNAALVFGESEIATDDQSKQLFYTMIRPFPWFSRLFEPAINIRISDMSASNGKFSLSNETGDYLIVRYEDLATAFASGLQDFGFSTLPPIERKNVSVHKPLATEIKRGFQTNEANRLSALMQNTEYARQFGYTT